MGDFQNILILLSFLLEVAVLFYIEIKAWKSLYTPLIFLMMPYTVVLLISIAISGRFGFVEFYYPSIFFWSIGLLLFAIPSYTLGFLMQKHQIPLEVRIEDTGMPKLLVYISAFVILLFAVRFKSLLGGAYFIGSAEFGFEFCGRGFWGHLRQLSLPLLIISIYFVNKQNKKLWLIILPLLVVAMLYPALGWIVIPCLTGVILRLYTGKTKLRLSLMLSVVLIAIVLFIGSYVLVLVVAGNSEFNFAFVSAMFQHFFHYLTSGTLGLSFDMQQGFPDMDSIEMLMAQVINLGKVIAGDDDFLIPLNPVFYDTSVTGGTNVRTFFGTIFINTGYVASVIYVLFMSVSMYLLKLATLRFNNIFIYTAYFFECAMLFMGWFDFYFGGLSALEIPVLCLVYIFLCKICNPKQLVELNSNKCN